MKRKIRVIFILILLILSANVWSFAAPGDYGKNLYDWLKEQAQWVAFGVVIIFAIPIIAKKAWAMFAGYALISAIALAIISAPETLKTIGTFLLNKITGG